MKIRWQLLHIILRIHDEVLPGVLEGRAAGQDVIDVIQDVRAGVREQTDAILILAPVAAESFRPIAP